MTAVEVYGGYMIGYGKEFYVLLFYDDRLTFCKVFEELTIRRHQYSRIIDEIVGRIRISRGYIGECREIRYDDISSIKLRREDDELLLVIEGSGETIIVHYPLSKEAFLKKGIKLYKKYMGLKRPGDPKGVTRP